MQRWKQDVFTKLTFLMLWFLAGITLLNVIQGKPFCHVLILSVATLLDAFMFFVAFFYERYFISAWLWLTIGVLVGLWFTTGGLQSAISYYFIIPFLFNLVFFEGRKRVLGFVGIVFVFLSLSIVEYHYPYLVYRYSSRFDRWLHVSSAALFYMIISAFFVSIVLREFVKEQIIVKLQNRRLEELSMKDSLTGLYNHDAIIEMLTKELEMVKRFGSPLSVLMFDVDDFKSINDELGHQVGDEVLKVVGSVVRESIRGADVPGRYGGDEFLVVLPQSNITGARLVADRIRNRLRSLRVSGLNRAITISGGIVGADGHTAEKLIRIVDNLLYRAKKQGKDRIEVELS